MPGAAQDLSLPALSVVILCGGESKRFGSEKGLATFCGAGLVERLLTRLGEISDDVFLSTNHSERYDHLDCAMVADLHPGCGPLGGFEASLRHARHDLLAVVACDMPFVSPGLLQYLARRAEGFDAVVAQRMRPPKQERGSGGAQPSAGQDPELGPEPLHAIYARSARPLITEAIERGHLKPVRLLGEINCLLVPPQEWSQVEPLDTRCFANVNTAQDLAALERDERP